MDKLLALLKANALESPRTLARMLDTTEADITSRIEDYEKRDVIRGYQAIINEDKLDLDRVRAVIEVRITPERGGGYDRIAHCIAKFPEVESLYLMSGGYDLLVFVTGRNLREVAGFVNERLATISGVLSTATHFALKTYKDQNVLMHPEKEHDRLSVTP